MRQKENVVDQDGRKEAQQNSGRYPFRKQENSADSTPLWHWHSLPRNTAGRVALPIPVRISVHEYTQS